MKGLYCILALFVAVVSPATASSQDVFIQNSELHSPGRDVQITDIWFKVAEYMPSETT